MKTIVEFACVFVAAFLLSSGPAYIVVTIHPYIGSDRVDEFKNTPFIFILYLVAGFSFIGLTKQHNTRTQKFFYVLWIWMVFIIFEFLV